MKIEDLIAETLESIDFTNKTSREAKKRFKLLTKAQSQWRQLVLDRINRKIGDC